jgi:outer membrane receptor protein involved in Fe transport
MLRRHHRYGKLAAAISATLYATTGLVTLAPEALAQDAPADEEIATVPATDPAIDVVTVTGDPLRALGSGPSESSFGFAKSLLETPRSVSFISEEQITLFGISTVEDLTRLVPGTYTTTRYGLQGGINVRGVPSDMYYRGMKRLQMQGHVRTVLSAMDGIEVIKGPPSPIYGMGRIGGFQNFTPKSSRASTGQYMRETAGFVQTTQGSYERNETQGGVGGPFTPFGKQGGYYVFGLFEDSDTYVKQVGARQEFIQATLAVDDAIGPFRIEFGGQAQRSITSGAYMNRVTQDMLDNGTYLAGQPMANLDVDGDGLIGYLESHTASPVRGNVSSTNQPLNQRYPWPTDPTGALLPIDAFPTVAGVPATMLAYLNAHPEINCHAADVMRSMPAGGPLPSSGELPVGMVLDPCTVETVPLDYRGNGAFEREQNAQQRLAYVDFIADENPDFTMKGQIFYDNIDSFKDSYLPYGERQYIKAIESKFTVTKRVSDDNLPDWVRINMLGSLNYRETAGWIKSSGGDFDWRQDINFNGGYHYDNTRFWTQLTNPDYVTGAADTSFRSSKFNSTGLGVMFDIDLFTNWNFVIGGRYDTSDAIATDMPSFNANTGRSPAPGVVCTAPGTGCPGAWLTTQTSAEGTDHGDSWSFSVSRQIGDRWRPYATAAVSSLQLSTGNDTLQVAVVRAGHIGEAELQEAGIKATFFDEKLQWTSAGYRQTRTDVTDPEDPTEGADVSSTEAHGVEFEVRWVPTRDLFFSAYVLNQFAKFTVPSSASISLTARQMGYQDVVDPVTGEVLYPAEAFFYGGKASVNLPVGNPNYLERSGNPETQAGVNMSYSFPNGLGLIFGANWFSEAWADRGRTALIPEATTINAGFTYEKGFWDLRVNGYNVGDEKSFRAGGGNAGLMSVMPGRRWEFTAKRMFD